MKTNAPHPTASSGARLPNGTNVRFDRATCRRLQATADRYRISKADLIRHAVLRSLPEWETRGVTLTA